MFARILVPLDGSPLAQVALPYALALAAATDAQLTLLSVVTPMQMLPDAYVPYNAGTEAAQLAAAGGTLDTLARSLRPVGPPIATAVAVGDAADEILRHAREDAADAIVMASHGRGGAFHWAFGSVARKVITGAGVPTLVVRAKDAPQQSSLPAPIRSILIPLDGSELAEAVIPLATDLARSFAASVTLARVVPFPGGIYFGSPYTPLVAAETFDQAMEEARVAAHAHLNRIADRLRDAGIGADTAVCDGDPASRLLALMDERQYDLVVMSSHGRSGIKRWILGSVAERLIEASHTPVLLIRSAVAETEPSDTVRIGAIHDAADTTY